MRAVRGERERREPFFRFSWKEIECWREGERREAEDDAENSIDRWLFLGKERSYIEEEEEDKKNRWRRRWIQRINDPCISPPSSSLSLSLFLSLQEM